MDSAHTPTPSLGPSHSGNLFSSIPTQKLPDELITNLVQTPHVRIERIISDGQITPEDEWYDQAEHEWVIVLQGSAALLIADSPNGEPREVEMQSGDYVLLNAHVRHRVIRTSDNPKTVWLAFFFPARAGEEVHVQSLE